MQEDYPPSLCPSLLKYCLMILELPQGERETLEESPVEAVELYIEGAVVVYFSSVLAETLALRASSLKMGVIPSTV